jgi:manganese efflux pump family protein
MIALLLIAVSLGLSNFAAAVGIGISGVDNRTRLRVGSIFGVLEAGMSVAGLALGRALTGPPGANAHYLDGAILIATGLYNLAQSYRSPRADDPVEPTDASPGTQPLPQHAGQLLVTGVAFSIDNLAVGFALGTSHFETRGDAGRHGDSGILIGDPQRSGSTGARTSPPL